MSEQLKNETSVHNFNIHRNRCYRMTEKTIFWDLRNISMTSRFASKESIKNTKISSSNDNKSYQSRKRTKVQHSHLTTTKKGLRYHFSAFQRNVSWVKTFSFCALDSSFSKGSKIESHRKCYFFYPTTAFFLNRWF